MRGTAASGSHSCAPLPGPGLAVLARVARTLASVALALTLLASPAAARAQTVASIAARGACSTAGVEGISAQLAETQMCMRPGFFVEFAPHAGITLSSSRIHPFLQASARDALWAAARTRPITVNSAFRTLADQYVLYHSGGCGLAATPGRSNHQTGVAIDVNDYATVRSALEAQGCRWLGSSDPVHFDCPGSDGRADAIRAFQVLWNLNNPGDRIAEDGLYGPQTESRLGRSPAGGFAMSGCAPTTCEAHCEGSVIVGADCGRGDCAAFGAYCSTAGTSAPRCVSAFCVADASEAPRAHGVCLPDGRVAQCGADGAVSGAMDCAPGTMCVVMGDAAACEAPVMPGSDGGPRVEVDAGALPPSGDAMPTMLGSDAGVDDGSDPRGVRLSGGCAAAPGTSSSAPVLGLLALLALCARRRRR